MQRVEADKLLIRLAIAFVDDTDFYSNGPLAEHHVQLIMKSHCALCEATGGKLQQSKIVFYFWQWVHRNGKQVIEQKQAAIEVHNEVIKSIAVDQSV